MTTTKTWGYGPTSLWCDNNKLEQIHTKGPCIQCKQHGKLQQHIESYNLENLPVEQWQIEDWWYTHKTGKYCCILWVINNQNFQFISFGSIFELKKTYFLSDFAALRIFFSSNTNGYVFTSILILHVYRNFTPH